jgi:hypothetical protein
LRRIQHAIGNAEALLVARLSVDAFTRFVRVHPARLDQSPDSQCPRGVHDDNRVELVGTSRFHQKWDGINERNVRVLTRVELKGLMREPVHFRMNNSIKSLAGVIIRKHPLGKPSAVERTLAIENVGAKRCDESPERLRAFSDRVTREDVRVDYRDTTGR